MTKIITSEEIKTVPVLRALYVYLASILAVLIIFFIWIIGEERFALHHLVFITTILLIVGLPVVWWKLHYRWYNGVIIGLNGYFFDMTVCNDLWQPKIDKTTSQEEKIKIHLRKAKQYGTALGRGNQVVVKGLHRKKSA